MEYKIEIEPYNQLFYINCNYNCIFSVMNYFEMNIKHLMLNYFTYYVFDQETYKIDIQYTEFVDEDLHMKNIGLLKYEFENKDEILNQIIREIECNHPITFLSDLFYIPIYEEYYKKVNIFRTLLIYGFNLKANSFFTLKQKSIDSLSYSEAFIDFKEIDEYVLMKDRSQYQINSYSKGTPLKTTDEFIFDYYTNLKTKYLTMSTGLEFLSQYINALQENGFYKVLENIENIIKGLNNIINAYKVKLYLFEFQNKYIADFYNEIYEEWLFIRNAVVKLSFHKDLTKFKLNEVKSKLEKIYEMEKKLLTILCIDKGY